ncbi:mechanosensitive ion channel family protein [Fluviispira multicolorata]|uniref:Mechanosensitive ion channel n=1 Tax=Fluviispira multicolorata TaxID=2654512 RepID=A0A833JE11_9BACT|nr:mechanosensitive ion channel family protein [Fluviispira multicolorata]KAB8032180.1 mechanosensitive ion channel [Fluviispira multicolorata]
MFNYINFESQAMLDTAYKVILAIVAFVIIYFIRVLIIKGLLKTNQKVQKIDPTLMPVTVTVIKYTAFVISILVILSIFGANTNGIVAFIGAAGLGLALALQDTLKNIASGIMLIFLRPFNINDFIECNSNSGTVIEINLFTTTLKTVDGLYLFVPNNLLWNASIKNYTRNGLRRLDFTVSIAYSDQLNIASKLLLNIAESDKRILKDPIPLVVVTSLTDNSVQLLMRCWTRVDDFWDINYNLNMVVKESLENSGITIPFPQRDVHLHISNKTAEHKNRVLSALQEH